jgi:predicted metal-dependent hydrolase
MTKIIYVDGLEVALTRKRVRNMNMRIKDPDGSIAVSVPYLTPESEVKRFIRSRRSWIDKSVRSVRERAAAHPEAESRSEKEARRRMLRERIARRLPEIEEITGLRGNGWTIRDMHTRWGSCNTKTHHLNFSLMLWDRSDTELDYVILHELVHTVVPNHGPDFYAMMDRFMPGWKAVRKRLRTK